MSNLRILMQQNKLFFKILLYFLALLIPIAIIGSIAYVNLQHLINRNVSEQLTGNLQSSSKTINTYLGMVQTTNNNLLLSDVIQQNLFSYDTLTDQEKINLPSIVRAISSNQDTIDSFIDSIFLFVDTKKVYTASGVIDFSTYFNTFYRFTDYSIDFWQKRLQHTDFFELLPHVKVTNYFNNATTDVIPSTSTQFINGKLVTIVTTISIPAIGTALRDNSIFDSTDYLIEDSHGNTILRTGGLSDADVSLIHSSFRLEGEHQTLQLHIAGNNSMVINPMSDSFGWKYYSITPSKAFNEKPASILNLLLWISISLIVIGVVFSLIFSMSLYNPIKNIRDILLKNDQDHLINSEVRSRGELQMIGNRINKLFEHNKDAASKVDRFFDERIEIFFADMINGHPWQQEKVIDILKTIGFDSGNYICSCFLFRFRRRFYHEIAEADRMRILDKLRTVLSSILQRQVNGYLIELEQQLFVFVANLHGDEDRSRFDLALGKVRITFEYDSIYCDLLIGVGNVYNKITDMDKSFSDSLTAIDNRTMESVAPILDAANMSIEHRYYYSFLDENKVVNGLKLGDLELLDKKVEEIIQFNRERGISYQFLGNLLAELFNTGCRYLTELRLTVEDFLTDAEYTTLINKNMLPKEYDARIQLLLRFYKDIIAKTMVKTERKSATLVSLITEYIEENYAKDLYLELIANVIGLSPKYISWLFKETTGTSITDYISLIRMEKAKELLLHTDLKISEIADQIGIFSRTTFLRQFKKHEGVSPIDYRNTSKIKRL